MAEYTLELYRIVKDINIFRDYSFYDNDLKNQFEKKFIDHYFFNEIGFETIERFIQRLNSKLNLKHPYYKQLYESELRAKGIDFLLNKDLKETFIRDIIAETENNQESDTNTNTTVNVSESSLDNGNATLDDLTTVSDNIEKVLGGLKQSGTSNNNMQERTELLSQGNIGITSSADLLEKWRSVMINLDEIIIEDLRDMFMLIF